MVAKNRSLVAIRRRVTQLASILHSGGLPEVRQRLVRRAYEVSGARELAFPLLIGDITDSDRVQWTVPSRAPERGRPLTVGWVMFPPSPGSGGHTTIFRMIASPRRGWSPLRASSLRPASIARKISTLR